MIKLLSRLAGDRGGGTSIEFAIIGPIFLSLAFASFEFGAALMAQAGMRQAVESGARYATIYPRPTDAQIVARVRSQTFGIAKQQIEALTVARATSGGLPTATITMRYRHQVQLLFLPPRQVKMNYERTVFQSPGIT
ncbi:TadE/TadG family type IV pilus assembly protein [Qipengyuania sp. CAU 1752]